MQNLFRKHRNARSNIEDVDTCTQLPTCPFVPIKDWFEYKETFAPGLCENVNFDFSFLV